MASAGGSNLAQIDDRAFCFRNNLLRDSQYDSVVDLPGRSADQGREVIARPHFGQSRERDYFEAHADRRKDETWHSRGSAKNSATSSGVSMSNISPGRRSTSAGKPFERA